jgi:hypothetical protein
VSFLDTPETVSLLDPHKKKGDEERLVIKGRRMFVLG